MKRKISGNNLHDMSFKYTLPAIHKLIFIFIFSLRTITGFAQTYSGIVKDASSDEVLPNVTISFYNKQKIHGLITNREGRFSFNADDIDSIKFTMIGYKSKVFYPPLMALYEVRLDISPAIMEEVVIKPLTGLEIIKKAITNISSYQPITEFENKGFYREIIKDKQTYFSVSEALFDIQYFPKSKKYNLKLDKGRSKEDVEYTRLFEDFHPGSGPQRMVEQSFILDIPECLTLEKFNSFLYHRDSVINYDGRNLYVISFDQKENVKEALEKGKVYITSDDFSVVRYEAENSAYGQPYIKSLKGTDKLIAEILKIDFKVKGWSRKLFFEQVENKWLINFAQLNHQIIFKQPKKNIDLDLEIESEMVMTDLNQKIIKKISEDEHWKRKDLIINLPTAFDSGFWGAKTILEPTEKITDIINTIAGKNGNETLSDSAFSDWKYLNRNTFVALGSADSITMVAVMKSNWNDESEGAFLYKDLEGDFIAQCTLTLSKNSDKSQPPDNGFQQAGILIRNGNTEQKENVFVSIGTGGNPSPKIFFKKTINNKSKTVVDKIDTMKAGLRLEKAGNIVTASARFEDHSEWKKLGQAKIDTVGNKLQVGPGCFAQFTGNGPKMRPDLRATFSDWNIIKN